MAGLGASLMPRTAAARASGAPWYSPRVGIASIMDQASLPGRAYASLGRMEDESYLDALGRTGPRYVVGQGEGDEMADAILRDPLTPVGLGLGSLLKGVRPVVGMASDLGSNAAGMAADQYATTGAVNGGEIGAGAGMGALLGLGGMAKGGKRSMISPEEREANLRNWFGDSKVVDADGKPLDIGGIYVNSEKQILSDAINGKKYSQFYDIAYKEGQSSKSKGYPFSLSIPDHAEFLPSDLMDYHISQGFDRYTWDALRSGYRDGYNANPRGYTSAKAVVAKRIGEVPESGVSMNFREQKAEPGLSVLGVYENGEYVPQNNSTFELFNDGPKRNVMGYKSENWIGSDGENILLRPIDLGPDGSKIKSATGNRGTFDPNDPNITHFAGPASTTSRNRATTRLERQAAQVAYDKYGRPREESAVRPVTTFQGLGSLLSSPSDTYYTRGGR